MGKTNTLTAEFPSKSPSDKRAEHSGDSKPKEVNAVKPA